MEVDRDEVNKTGWLFRTQVQQGSIQEEWKSFKSSDISKIEAAYLLDVTRAEGESSCVVVRGGRWEVNLKSREMRARYHRSDLVKVRRCTWCWKDGKVWRPATNETDDAKIDEDYLCHRRSSGDRKPSDEISLELASITVTFMLKDGVLAASFKKKERWSLALFKTAMKRGWGGEFEADDPFDDQAPAHLVLVVHGIGESLFSRDDVPLPSFLDVVDRFGKLGRELSPACGSRKVEMLPIEWFDKVAEKKRQLGPVTLPSIPKLRGFANEALLDGMLLLTPRWRKVIFETVVERISATMALFAAHNPSWQPDRWTVVGHSLGSVILFELLSSPELAHTWPAALRPLHFVAVGSPIAAFVNTFEDDPAWLNARLGQLRLQRAGTFRNCFHPNDPVAYRLEPLLAPCAHGAPPTTPLPRPAQPARPDLPADACEDAVAAASAVSLVATAGTVSPVFIDTASGEDRLHVKLKRAAEGLEQRKAAVGRAVSSWMGGATAVAPLWALAATKGAGGPALCRECDEGRVPPRLTLVPGGEGASGGDDGSDPLRHRIDFVFQIPELELGMSEYLSALQAHNTYFELHDFAKFIVCLVAEKNEAV